MITAPNAPTVTTVLPLHSRTLPSLNHETYQALEGLIQPPGNPVLVLAACDDIPLQRRLAAGLDRALLATAPPMTTWLRIDPQTPDVAQQVMACWRGGRYLPYLQILGVERLTSSAVEEQAQFLASLRRLAAHWPQVPWSVVLWLPRPWLRQVQRAAPQLMQRCDRTFNFLGDPTPLMTPEPVLPPLGLPQADPGIAAPPHPETIPLSPNQEAAIAPPSPLTPGAGLEKADSIPPDGKTLPEPQSNVAPGVWGSDLWQQLEADLSRLDRVHLDRTPINQDSANQHSVSQHSVNQDSVNQHSANQDPFNRDPINCAQVVDLVSFDSSQWQPYRPMVTIPGPDHAAPVSGDRTLTLVRPLNPAQTSLPNPEMETAPKATPALADAIAPWVERADQLRDQVEGGDRATTTLNQAIQAHAAVMAHPAWATLPQQGEIMNDLGSLYWLLAQTADGGDAGHRCLETSQHYYEAALALPPATLSKALQVQLHSNLGSVYGLLAQYQQPEAYLNQAVRAFHRALQHVSPPEGDPYATLQTHLGTTYWSLAQHSHAPHHLHRAITAYQEALAHRPAHQDPLERAHIQNNLGIAYWSLAQYERPLPLLHQAIAAYQDVLAYRTPRLDPLGHGATQNNLGTAYWDLGQQYPAQSTQQYQAWAQAIAAYGTALATIAPLHQQGEAIGFDPWATHHSLGVVHDHLALGADTPEAQTRHWHQAVAHYVQALEGWEAQGSSLKETALQGLLSNLRHQAHTLGPTVQHRALTQIPPHWLPEIWRQL